MIAARCVICASFRRCSVSSVLQEPVCQKHPRQSFPCIDKPCEIDILEQRRLDGFVASDVVVRGGFPQLILAPVNFDALYAQHLEDEQKGNQKDGSEKVH